MKNHYLNIVFCSLFLLAGCSSADQIRPAIPTDQLAFYLIESYHEAINLKSITIDSIREFGNRIIGYNDIINYDTSNFVLELTPSGKVSFDSLYLARFARHFPLAVVSNGQILFGAYISHSAVSSIANWYSLKPYYEVYYPNNFVIFSPPPPPFINFATEPDCRIDSRMLQVLKDGNKLKQ
jgi:hypothetical protein